MAAVRTKDFVSHDYCFIDLLVRLIEAVVLPGLDLDGTQLFRTDNLTQ